MSDMSRRNTYTFMFICRQKLKLQITLHWGQLAAPNTDGPTLPRSPLYLSSLAHSLSLSCCLWLFSGPEITQAVWGAPTASRRSEDPLDPHFVGPDQGTSRDWSVCYVETAKMSNCSKVKNNETQHENERLYEKCAEYRAQCDKQSSYVSHRLL